MPPIRTSRKYQEPRAHELRARYLRMFGGAEIPVPVESIAEDLLGLRIEQSRDLGDLSGTLLPADRLIVLNAFEAVHDGLPIRRHRYTIAHEVGHWVCHVVGAPADTVLAASYCRAADLSPEADRAVEREANVFAAELLMPEAAVRRAWNELGDLEHAAAQLDVSQNAMGWRLYNLGLTSEKPA